MKLPSLFTKAPNHKRFNYTPRFYDPQEEERKEREERIRKELQGTSEEELSAYRSRIAGSFKSAKKTAGRMNDPSASLLRSIILTFLAIWLIAYLQFGSVMFYALFLLVPFYLFLKFRK